MGLGAYLMSRWLGLAIVVGTVGCGSQGLPIVSHDMAMKLGDMAADMQLDMAVPDDLGPVDMAIPNDAIKPVSYSAFANDYATALCAHLSQCGKVDSDAASQAACREVNAIHFGRDFDSEIMRGHVVVNELQCLDAISNSRCDGSDTGVIQQKCVTFLFVGKQLADQECLSSEECADGNYCLHSLNDGGTARQVPGCLGKCEPYKATGCDEVDSCNLATAICAGGNCIALPGDGMPCLFGAGGACQRGLYCSSFDATPTCRMPMMQMAAGGSCDPAQSQNTTVAPCGPGANGAGMYCKFDKSPSPTSASCTPKMPSGGACDKTLYNLATDNPCVDGFHCDTTASGTSVGVCNPFRTLGGDCTPPNLATSPENSAPDCKVNFYCDGTSKKCTALAADGSGCTISASCLAYQRNNYSSSPYTCLVDNPDAGSFKSCEAYQNFGTSCLPGFQDDICYPAAGFNSGANTSYCAETKNGGGSCAPRCQ